MTYLEMLFSTGVGVIFAEILSWYKIKKIQKEYMKNVSCDACNESYKKIEELQQRIKRQRDDIEWFQSKAREDLSKIDALINNYLSLKREYLDFKKKTIVNENE